MAEVDFTLMMNLLKRLTEDMAEVKQDVREVKLRLTLVEGHHASVMASLHLLQEQLDRVTHDVRLIKRRLDLVDAD